MRASWIGTLLSTVHLTWPWRIAGQIGGEPLNDYDVNYQKSMSERLLATCTETNIAVRKSWSAKDVTRHMRND